ncbi:ATP-binding protein [Halopseudomonas pachastrellae]|nr:ATP-binding protein [Halopseudomonas pachastrellae]
MLKQLKLTNVGPAPLMELEFGERLNLITGDNGLGKSFLLDIAWWALTGKWPAEVNSRLTTGRIALPNDKKQDAVIDLEVLAVSGGKTGSRNIRSFRPELAAFAGQTHQVRAGVLCHVRRQLCRLGP